MVLLCTHTHELAHLATTGADLFHFFIISTFLSFVGNVCHYKTTLRHCFAHVFSYFYLYCIQIVGYVCLYTSSVDFEINIHTHSSYRTKSLLSYVIVWFATIVLCEFLTWYKCNPFSRAENPYSLPIFMRTQNAYLTLNNDMLPL